MAETISPANYRSNLLDVHRGLSETDKHVWIAQKAPANECKIWAHQDSNLEPKDYESSALTIEL